MGSEDVFNAILLSFKQNIVKGPLLKELLSLVETITESSSPYFNNYFHEFEFIEIIIKLLRNDFESEDNILFNSKIVRILANLLCGTKEQVEVIEYKVGNS